MVNFINFSTKRPIVGQGFPVLLSVTTKTKKNFFVSKFTSNFIIYLINFQIMYQFLVLNPMLDTRGNNLLRCNLLEVKSRALDLIFRKLHQISWFSMVFSMLWETVSIISSLLSGRLFGAFTTNYVPNLNSFSTRRTLQDLKLSLL